MNQKKPEKSQWWTRFIPVKGDDKREIIRKCIFWVAIVVFVCSIVYILSVKQESVNTEKLNQELGNMLVQDEDYEVVDDYPDDYLTKFAALWERNEDIAGWIEIASTQVNYPVVQYRNNSYYERRDFDQKDNNHGVPFVDYRVDQKKPSTNTVIYAHNMNDGQMFGELMNYKKISYYKEHPTFRYDSVYKENEYKILGVFLVTANDPEFLYHSMIDLDEAGLTEFVNQVRARSLINTKIDVNTADKLVTLSTCDYSFKDAQGNRVARFVVVGRAVREGEDPTVDTSIVTLNASPVMPAEWYEQIKRNQEAAELAAAEAASQAALESVNPDNITAWLTQEEIDAYTAEGYSPEDLEFFASERRYALLEWLDEEEMTGMTPAEKLSAMRSRRDRKWLSEEDRDAHLTEEEKLEKIAANQAAAAILTQEELAKCRSWKEIQELLATKQQAAEAAKQKEEKAAGQIPAKLTGNYRSACLAEMIKADESKWPEIIQKYLDKFDAEHKHNYKATVTAPTCGAPGYTTYVCGCGDKYIGDEVAATGQHTYKDTVVDPTETEQGYTKHTCTVCGYSYEDNYTGPTGSSSSSSGGSSTTPPESSGTGEDTSGEGSSNEGNTGEGSGDTAGDGTTSGDGPQDENQTDPANDPAPVNEGEPEDPVDDDEEPATVEGAQPTE